VLNEANVGFKTPDGVKGPFCESADARATDDRATDDRAKDDRAKVLSPTSLQARSAKKADVIDFTNCADGSDGSGDELLSDLAPTTGGPKARGKKDTASDDEETDEQEEEENEENEEEVPLQRHEENEEEVPLQRHAKLKATPTATATAISSSSSSSSTATITAAATNIRSSSSSSSKVATTTTTSSNSKAATTTNTRPSAKSLSWVTDPIDCRLLSPDKVAINTELEGQLDIGSCALIWKDLSYSLGDGKAVDWTLVLAQHEWVKHTSLLVIVNAVGVIELQQGDVLHTPYLHGFKDTRKSSLEQYYRVVEGNQFHSHGTQANTLIFAHVWKVSTQILSFSCAAGWGPPLQ
jgi:hypothetical protein